MDEGDLREVCGAVAPKLDVEVVVGCFRELCPLGRMGRGDFRLIWAGFGDDEGGWALGDGQFKI